MNTQRWARISDLLERVIELAPDERRELLARESADDATIAEEVELLVAADTRARSFLEPGPTRTGVPTSSAPIAAGTRIGGYTLIRRIGVGGMGVVFEANQERPQRRVALKLVQSVFATSSTLLRFRYEAEALGRLRHAGIAQVYEAGIDVDPSGVDRPFLAMEFVDSAQPITEYVRAQTLGYEGIVRLYMSVCAAVQHGHDRGVLHRDIKASNVLVDATGAPKLIDFGVAKLLGDTQTRATEAGEIVGTLASMSPEQLEGDLEVLDVRSDVYALGALLYELLCGRPVVDLKGLSLAEALVRARNANHPAPSSVRPDLPIELEWIVMRALESERERRYGSAAELAHDLDRYLGDEPVEASPPSTVYRVRKFVRRNRIVVAAVTTVVVAVLGGAITALVQRDRAVVAKERAETAEMLAAKRLADLESEARTNRELVDFQRSILASADPDQNGRDARVVDALEAASLELDARTDLDPELWLALRRSIVDAYLSLGASQDSDRQLELMRPVWEAHYAPEDPKRLALERLHLESDIDRLPGNVLYPRALSGLERAARIRDTHDCEHARWQVAFGRILKELGRLEEARVCLESAHARLSAKYGPASDTAINTQILLAQLLATMRQTGAAEASERDAYEVCLAEYGADHRLTLMAKSALAFSVGQNGDPHRALEMYREIVGAHVRRTGPNSLQALRTRLDLAEFLFRMQRPSEAIDEVDAVIADAVIAVGERGEFVHEARCRRAYILLVLDRIEEGMAGFEEALRGAEANLGSDDSATIQIRAMVAYHLFRLGRFDQALPLSKEAWLASCRVLGEESGHTLARGNGYAVVLANLERKSEAIVVLEWLLGVQDRTLGPTHEDTILTLKNLTMIQLESGDQDGALCSGSMLVARAGAGKSDVPDLGAGAHWALGHVLKESGDLESAWEQLAIGSHLWSRGPEAGKELAIYGLIDEANVLEKLDRSTEALDILERAVSLASAPGLSPSMRTRALTELAELLQRAGRSERARELAELVVFGTTETEPKIRARAERILDPG